MPRVPSTSTAAKPSSGTSSKQASVEDFLATLDHPRKAEILALRQLLLNLGPTVTETVKWNAPNFRTSGDFATFHLHTQDSARLILHLGAKKRADSGIRATLVDATHLLTWLGPDRASVEFRTQEEIAVHQAELTAVLRQWITFL